MQWLVIAGLGTFLLDTHNPNHLISIPIVGTYNLRIYKKNFTSQYLTGYDYHARYQIKINKRSISSLDLDIRITRVPSSSYYRSIWLSLILKVLRSWIHISAIFLLPRNDMRRTNHGSDLSGKLSNKIT